MKVEARIIVKGLVQGVGFRWFVQREAQELGLTGFVRNLYNGNVEVEVEGERGLIEELIKKIRIGNRSSRVTDLEIDWLKCNHKYDSFTITF